MIYRHAWKVDPHPHTIEGTGQLKISYLKQQLLAIGTLGAICQQMRTEALDEYFHHAQAYLRWDFYGGGSGCKSPHNVYYKKLIPSSPLLLAHLRHVSFYWDGEGEFKRREITVMEAFYWLQSLKQLRTLEVVITGSDLSCLDGYRSKQMSLILENLRGLEKATIKFDFADLSQSRAGFHIARLNNNKWFLKLKREIVLEVRAWVAQ